MSSNLMKKGASIFRQQVSIRRNLNQARNLASFSARKVDHDPMDLPEKSPPEVPTAPPFHKPAVPSEMPRTHNVPDFDPIPPEQPADPPPLSPGPNPGPECPGPPNHPSPAPEVPRPPSPSPPGQPEVVPPHGPDVVPPKPPEPGPPYPTQPDIPTPFMASFSFRALNCQ